MWIRRKIKMFILQWIYFSTEYIMPWNILTLNYFSFIYSAQHCELKYSCREGLLLPSLFIANSFREEKGFHIFHRRSRFYFATFLFFSTGFSSLSLAIRRKMYLWGKLYAEINAHTHALAEMGPCLFWPHTLWPFEFFIVVNAFVISSSRGLCGTSPPKYERRWKLPTMKLMPMFSSLFPPIHARQHLIRFHCRDVYIMVGNYL